MRQSGVKPLTLLILTTGLLWSASPALANPCGKVPHLMIVLDRSGSMKSQVGSQSKWTIAKSAIYNLTTHYSGQIDFGLILFPRWPHVKNCSSGKVNVNVGPGTGGSINSMLNTAYPDGDTPIGTSLDAARTYLSSVSYSGKPQYVLLVTDGKETCQPNWPNVATAKLYSAGIKTYVVGFGSGVKPSSLTDAAKAGGTGKYYQADNYAQLEAALKTIAAAVSCCGDGKLDPGELCDTKITWGTGACPTSCNDYNKCTIDTLVGSGCNKSCIYSPITTPKHGDGCCPNGANSATDNDCPPSCGNGVVDAGEKCDTKIPYGASGACPKTCNDGNPCTQDTMNGNGCQAYCNYKNTCPQNKCGNGKVDGGEKCDTKISWGKWGGCPQKPSDCDDKNSKTKDSLVGAGCQAYCHHTSSAGCGNGVVDAGEWCDTKIPQGQKGACPKNCNDNDKCTKDMLMGSGCLAKCSYTPITSPKHGDGCCPLGASWQNDNDCPKNSKCGDGKLDPGEKCDPGIKSGPGKCKTSCNDKNPCTSDQLGGSKCNVKCFYNPKKANKTKKDGCCPGGLSSAQDADCPPPCGPDKQVGCVDVCKGIQCPEAYYCKYGKCVPWPKGTGGDGGAGGNGNNDGMTGACDCRVGSAAEGLPLLSLGLLALLLIRRRRN